MKERDKCGKEIRKSEGQTNKEERGICKTDIIIWERGDKNIPQQKRTQGTRKIKEDTTEVWKKQEEVRKKENIE
jgi:hypothetical protein